MCDTSGDLVGLRNLDHVASIQSSFIPSNIYIPCVLSLDGEYFMQCVARGRKRRKDERPRQTDTERKRGGGGGESKRERNI